VALPGNPQEISGAPSPSDAFVACIASFDPEPTAPICLAVSGGGDSVALLRVAADWARDHARAIICLTVDHGLRAAARDEALCVGELCARLGIAHHILNVTLPGRSQAGARTARHAVMSDAARKLGARLLLTGHTRDDRIETFLMRARQGSGWFGLGSIDPVSVSPSWPNGRGVFLAGPFLNISRMALRRELIGRGQDWCEDPSNRDPAYERVRIRGQLARAPSLAAPLVRALDKLARLRRAELLQLAWLMELRVRTRPDATLEVMPDGLSQDRLVRLLSVLVQIAAGRADPPPGEGLRRLAGDIVAAGPRGRTLAGSWAVRRGDAVRLGRDPGALAGLAAPGPEDMTWDGRFERCEDGVRLEPGDAMACAASLPGQAGWRAICSDRVAHAIMAWRAAGAV